MARLCCKSGRGSDPSRHDIFPRKAAGWKDKQCLEYLSAVAVQAGLYMGSEIEGKALAAVKSHVQYGG